MSDRRWWSAPDARKIGEALIADSTYEEFEAHHWLDIRYVFTNEAAGRDGCKIAASARKAPGLYSALLQAAGLAAYSADLNAVPNPVFIVQIWAEAWSNLDDTQRRALIHHELMHIDGLEARVRPHSIEEHNQTVRRFGEWSAAVGLFRRVLDEATRE